MTKTIDTLVADIEKLFEGKDLSEHIAHFTDQLGLDVVAKFKEYAEEKTPVLRMSNIGKPRRQLWYDLKGFKQEPLSAVAKFKFLYGTILEALVIHLAKEAGHKVEREQEHVQLDGIDGHYDCLIDGIVVDVKSCSTRSFEKFRNGTLIEDDPFGYVAQLAGYSSALGGIDGAFVAIDKTLGHICLLKFSKEDLAMFNARQKIKIVRQDLNSDIPPERCYEDVADGKSGNRKLAVGCSYCGHKQRCWEGLRTFIYASGPRYLTQVARLPEVEEVKN